MSVKRKKFLTVYLVKNLITGEKYVGQHATNDLNDLYLGSGKLVRQAIAKYGEQAFTKTTLKICNSQQELDAAEKRFIAELKPEYNIASGGKGFSGINEVRGLNNSAGQYKKANAALLRKFKTDKQFRDKYVKEIGERARKQWADEEYRKNQFENNPILFGKYWTGRKHDKLTKDKISKARAGKQTTGTLGKHWYTDGINDIIAYECPEGYFPGRTLKP